MDGYLQRLQEAIGEATEGMNVTDLSRHPDGKWSTAQVLEHLYLSYHGTVKGFEGCLRAGKPVAGPSTFQQQIAAWIVIGLGYLPHGRKAPERTVPRGMSAEEVIKTIGPEIIAMDRIISQCETQFGEASQLLDHPILGPLTAQQWRKFHWIHGRHHVKQIWKLRGKS